MSCSPRGVDAPTAVEQVTSSPAAMPAGHRMGLAGLGLELVATTILTAMIADIRGGQTLIWTWAGVWVVLRIGFGGASLPRTVRQLYLAPLVSGAGTIIIAFVVENFLSPSVAGKTFLVLIVVLSCVSVAIRGLILTIHQPRTVRLVTAVSQVTNPDPQVHHVVIAETIRRDPAAVSSAVQVAVDSFGAETVDLCAGLAQSTIDRLAWDLRTRHVSMRLPLDVSAVRASRLVPELTAGQASVLWWSSVPSLRMRLTKRLVDVLGSLALIIVLCPLLITVALVIRADSRGPVMFNQTRIGLDGTEFNILKFRTMVVDADVQLAALLTAQNRGDTPLFKVAHDPRITRVGGFLRRYSLDELPQLFNVLGGSMSLVGPRPQRAEEVALYTGTAIQRLGTKPGMTGLWQVSGRSNLPWDQAQELDVYYVHNWSLSLDLTILLKTARAVLASEGAV